MLIIKKKVSLNRIRVSRAVVFMYIRIIKKGPTKMHTHLVQETLHRYSIEEIFVSKRP